MAKKEKNICTITHIDTIEIVLTKHGFNRIFNGVRDTDGYQLTVDIENLKAAARSLTRAANEIWADIDRFYYEQEHNQ